jgi:hypothetical protein
MLRPDLLNRPRANTEANQSPARPSQAIAPNQRRQPSKPQRRDGIDLLRVANTSRPVLRSDRREQAQRLIHTDMACCRILQSWSDSGASIPHSLMRWPCISIVSPSMTVACPDINSPWEFILPWAIAGEVRASNATIPIAFTWL